MRRECGERTPKTMGRAAGVVVLVGGTAWADRPPPDAGALLGWLACLERWIERDVEKYA